MKPFLARSRRFFLRRLAFLGAATFVWGCAGPAMRSQSPDLDEITDLDSSVKLVGDFARPWGVYNEKLEAVALATQLNRTGSDPPPDARRTLLRDEMKTRGVRDPDDILALDTTSLVIVRAWLPPGVQKGDRVDVEVLVPRRSETTSLEGGWLMPTRLTPMEVLGGQVRTGAVAGHAQGAILADAVFAPEGTDGDKKRGRVMGGGVSLKNRSLGLLMKGDNLKLEGSSVVGAAINRRFYTYDEGVKRGVATPKNDRHIELLVPGKYRHNIKRYLNVVRSVPIRETNKQRVARLDNLEMLLFQPTSSAKASFRLEAIGKEAVPVLKKGMASADPEVRFHSAEALAYLDQEEAVRPLFEAARDHRAFRWHALTALKVMDHIAAYDALTELLHVPSVETRYGAFAALRERNPKDPLVQGEEFDNVLRMHIVPSNDEPVIHISRSRTAEVVLFGSDVPLAMPLVVAGGTELLIKSTPEGQIRISRFGRGEDGDQRETCDPTVASLIRTIVAMKGDYGDVWAALKELKRQNAFDAPLVVEALPRPGRKYETESAARPDGESEMADDEASQEFADEEMLEGEPRPSFFGKMTRWFGWR